MNPLDIAKAVVDMIVSAGTGAVVGNLIKQSTPLDAKITSKIGIAVGGFVLSGLVGNQASKYASEQIDSTLQQVKELKSYLPKKKN